MEFELSKTTSFGIQVTRKGFGEERVKTGVKKARNHKETRSIKPIGRHQEYTW